MCRRKLTTTIKKALQANAKLLTKLTVAGLLLTSMALTSQAANHGAAILKNPVGPDGTARAHRGDTITATITVQNLDTAGDSITVTNIFDVAHNTSGDTTTGNLLPGGTPVTLVNFLDSIDVVTTYPVAANQTDPLQDDAKTGGVDNHNGPGGTQLPQAFMLTFPGTVTILIPCIDVHKECTIPQTAGNCYLYGAPVTVTGYITNCGNCLLSSVTLVDNPTIDTSKISYSTVQGPGGGAAFANTLDVGQWVTYSFSYTPSGAALCKPTDTVTASGTDALGLTVTKTDTATCPVCINPSFTVKKTCPASVPFSMNPQDITATVTVHNDGNVPIDFTGSDDNAGLGAAIDITPFTLNPGDPDKVITVKHTVPAKFCGPLTDIVTIIGKPACADPITKTDKCTTTITVNPLFTVKKTCPATVAFKAAAQDIDATVTVHNGGDVPIDFTGSDDNAGLGAAITITPFTLNPGDPDKVITVKHTVPARFCGPLTDIVTITGKPACAGPITKTDTCTTTIPVTPSIKLTKECGPAPAKAGDPIPFKITVENNGDVTLKNVVITDTVDNGGQTQTKSDCGILDPGQTCVFTGSNPTTLADACKTVTDTGTVTAVDICGNKEVTAKMTCPIQVPCQPCIKVTKGIVCGPAPDAKGVVPSCDETLTYGSEATGIAGLTNASAFCYQIVVTNCGDVPLTGIIVTDDLLDIAGLFPTTLAVKESKTVYYGWSYPTPGDYKNTVSAQGTSGATTVKSTASATAHVKPISVTCDITLTGGDVVDGNSSGCQTTFSASGKVTFSLVIHNTGQADLMVTPTGLPALKDCSTGADVTVEPVLVAAGKDSAPIVGCTDVTCPGGAQYQVSVQGYAVATTSTGVQCVYDSKGNAIWTDAHTCSACANCVTPVTCRTTGGGDLLPGVKDVTECYTVTTTLFPDHSSSGPLVKVTHGGQLGAPYSHQDCGEVLGNPCIRGQWQHVRHYQGKGNPRDTVTALHTVTPKGQFDALTCACLPCCDNPLATSSHGKKFELCNKDDKVCGPEPRPAPANALIWSGLGKYQASDDTSPGAEYWAVVRVYIVDRSEPGGVHPGGAVAPADIYCFQAWRTTVKVSKKPDGINNVATALRKAVAKDSCDFLDGLVNGNVSGLGALPSSTVYLVDDKGNPIIDPDTNKQVSATADISDEGPLQNGNRQIHPSTSATCN